MGVRKKRVRSILPKRRAPRRKGRRVFKTSAFSRKKIEGLSVLPVLWRYMYPEAFEELPSLPLPEGLEEMPREYQGLDYDPRTTIPLEQLYDFLRQEIVTDSWWKAMAETCAETGEWASHPVYEIAPAPRGDEQIESIIQDFRLPPEWMAIRNEDEKDETFDLYFDLLASVINQIMPEDLKGWFTFGLNDEYAFGLWYNECQEEA